MREAPSKRSLPTPAGVVVERDPAPLVREPFRDGARGGTLRIHWQAAPRRFALLLVLLAAVCGSIGAYGLSPEFEVGDSVPGAVIVATELLGSAYCLWAAVALWANRVRVEIRDAQLRAWVGPVRVPGLAWREPIEIALDEIARVSVAVDGHVFLVVARAADGRDVPLPFGVFERPVAAFVVHAIEVARGAG